VYNALQSIGITSRVSDNPSDLKSAEAVILPGVGAFEDGMTGLRNKNFIDPIREFVSTGKPFLGICLGMQLLMTKSYEFGEHLGLDLIAGEVVSFKDRWVEGQSKFKVPHIGWNGLSVNGQAWTNTILTDIPEGQEMYFVHSFHAVPGNKEHVLAQTEYAGMKFCSACRKNNIYGCQFHPEKSSTFGLKILNNFVGLIK
jgi:glutamine amidotransferase